jgi:hypothetical protein
VLPLLFAVELIYLDRKVYLTNKSDEFRFEFELKSNCFFRSRFHAEGMISQFRKCTNHMPTKYSDFRIISPEELLVMDIMET